WCGCVDSEEEILDARAIQRRAQDKVVAPPEAARVRVFGREQAQRTQRLEVSGERHGRAAGEDDVVHGKSSCSAAEARQSARTTSASSQAIRNGPCCSSSRRTRSVQDGPCSPSPSPISASLSVVSSLRSPSKSRAGKVSPSQMPRAKRRVPGPACSVGMARKLVRTLPW